MLNVIPYSWPLLIWLRPKVVNHGESSKWILRFIIIFSDVSCSTAPIRKVPPVVFESKLKVSCGCCWTFYLANILITIINGDICALLKDKCLGYLKKPSTRNNFKISQTRQVVDLQSYRLLFELYFCLYYIHLLGCCLNWLYQPKGGNNPDDK